MRKRPRIGEPIISTDGRFLIVGGDAEIGAATARHLRKHGCDFAATTRRPELVGPDRPSLDLAISPEAWESTEGIRAAALFAGVARLYDCACDPAGSHRVNVVGTLSVIDKLRARGIPVLWLSSDKVFDGSQSSVAVNTPPNPVSAYGRQKAATEAALREHMSSGPPVAILRLAKVVSPGMPLLVQWARLLAAGEPIRAFDDMMMAPTPIGQVCSVIAQWLQAPVSDILQLSGPRDVSYAEAADYLARKLDADPALVQRASAYSADLPEGSTARNTTLDSSLIAERYGIVMPDVWDVIDQVVRLPKGTAK